MTVDEYDDLIRDPSDFWLRKYLPRIMESFIPFGTFQPFTAIIENMHVNNLSPFSMPAVKEMFNTFIKAGEAFERYQTAVKPYLGMGATYGFPSTAGVFCFSPFDILGDTLRGTTNIMKDMFRRPQKLLEALDVITEAVIHNILNDSRIDDSLTIFYPLHKGADGWMSQSQFEKFYWPSLKKVMDALINEGLIQNLFAEGSFNSRLDFVNQFPKGSVSWLFDQSDMAKAKEALGKDCCISGNVPTSLIVTGTPQQVKDYCRNLIETAGKDGGYILAPGANAENPKLENLLAMVETVNEYGYYK
jgi:uroporphyrinogen-III decarboxylase